MDLPDFDKARREAGLSVDEMRAKMKREGIEPPRPGPAERNITLACTGENAHKYSHNGSHMDWKTWKNGKTFSSQ